MELVNKKSYIFYDSHPILGDRVIDRWGVVRPIPRHPQATEISQNKSELAREFVPILIRGIEDRGLVVKTLSLTGSVASGYARGDSDIDLEMAVEGMTFDQLSEEYFAKQIEISDMVIEILGSKDGDLYKKFKDIDVHLENSYENQEFRRVREGRAVNYSEGQYENKAELR